MKYIEMRCAVWVAFLVLVAACTSGSEPIAEPAPTPVIPTLGSEPAPTPTPPVEEPTVEEPATAEPDDSTPTIDDFVDVALGRFEQDLSDHDPSGGDLLDVGPVTTSFDDQTNIVTITSCPWFSAVPGQVEHNANYAIADLSDPTSLLFSRIEETAPCTNEAMLIDAAEFTIDVQLFEAEWFGPDGDPEDPRADDFYDASRVDDFREANRRDLGLGRAIFYSPTEGGTAVAWARSEANIIVIAVRWPYDDRYGWYNIDSEQRLPQLSTLDVPAELQGDDHVLFSALRRTDDGWRTFTFDELYGIKCSESNCVETVTNYGYSGGRPRNQGVPFGELEYGPLPPGITSA